MDLQEPHLLDRDPTSQHRRKLHLAGARSPDGVVLSGKAAKVPFGGISDVPGPPITLLGLVPGWPGSSRGPSPHSPPRAGPRCHAPGSSDPGTVIRGYPTRRIWLADAGVKRAAEPREGRRGKPGFEPGGDAIRRTGLPATAKSGLPD
jgi:hypothetical protein